MVRGENWEKIRWIRRILDSFKCIINVYYGKKVIYLLWFDKYEWIFVYICSKKKVKFVKGEY